MSSVIPDGWSEVEFDNFTTLQRGKDLTRAQFREGRVPVAGSNGIIGYHDTAITKAPGVTVGRSGSVGKVTVYNEDFWPHNTSLYVKEFHGNDPHFAGYLLESLDLSRFKTGASVPTLDRNSFKTLPILVPPVPEQKKIAQILSTVQRAIEVQERIIQTTTELKKALMHKLFTEGLRNEPQKQTEIGPVPESWEIKRFDSFAVLQRGFDITKKDQRPGDYPVVSSGGIGSYHDEAKVKGPGVVIGRKGSLGTVHYIASDYWPHDTTLWIKDFKGNNPQFVAYLLETMRLKRFDTGAANPTLNRNIVHGEKIAIPPKYQQVEIGEALKAVESKITIHERRKRSFQDLFRTLLHELMTAKTRLHSVHLRSQDA
jgi:type I restriction enzyme S subunit